MKSTHQFQVKAPIKSIYDNVIPSDRWLSFVPGYLSLESADPNWPNKGSSITVRFGYGLWSFSNKVTVVKHEYGRHFSTHEEFSSGMYIDNVDLTFQKEDGITTLTFVNDTTIKSSLLNILFSYPIRWTIRELILWPQVKKRIKVMVEK